MTTSTVPSPPNRPPKYLYKIHPASSSSSTTSTQEGSDSVLLPATLSALDASSGYIHLSTAEQVCMYICSKTFHSNTYIPSSLPPTNKHPTLPAATDPHHSRPLLQYPHDATSPTNPSRLHSRPRTWSREVGTCSE